MLFESFSEIFILLRFISWFVFNCAAWRIAWWFFIAIFWRNWLRFVGHWRLWIFLWLHDLIRRRFFPLLVSRWFRSFLWFSFLINRRLWTFLRFSFFINWRLGTFLWFTFFIYRRFWTFLRFTFFVHRRLWAFLRFSFFLIYRRFWSFLRVSFFISRTWFLIFICRRFWSFLGFTSFLLSTINRLILWSSSVLRCIWIFCLFFIIRFFR